VIHSATKFLGGHADALGGIVCGREDFVRDIYPALAADGGKQE
jgi:cystathionine gamma-synthase